MKCTKTQDQRCRPCETRSAPSIHAPLGARPIVGLKVDDLAFHSRFRRRARSRHGHVLDRLPPSSCLLRQRMLGVQSALRWSYGLPPCAEMQYLLLSLPIVPCAAWPFSRSSGVLLAPTGASAFRHVASYTGSLPAACAASKPALCSPHSYGGASRRRGLGRTGCARPSRKGWCGTYCVDGNRAWLDSWHRDGVCLPAHADPCVAGP